jgi:uncharacterized membrane protein YcaP (DUF421 family)
MWFTGWQPIGRAVLFALIAYFALITLVRLLGKRTISKMNPGDFVVTVALGSIAANLIVSNDISLGQGLAALGALLLLQFTTEWATTHSSRLRHLADGLPVLLAYRGQMMHEVMRRENIHEEDILAAAREHGLGRLADIHAVVLEVDGAFSVIATRDAGDDTLKDVKSGA